MAKSSTNSLLDQPVARRSNDPMARSASKSRRPGPPPGRRCGMQDIARDLGISVSLVSRVLNNRLGTAGASPAMIKAIHKKALELSYRKNATATSLASGRQNAIGVFIHRHGVAGSNISSAMVEGIAAAAVRLHQRLVLQYYTTLPELSDLLPLAHGNAVDGLILGGVPHQHLARQWRLVREDLPVVTIHADPIHPDVPNIGINQEEVIRLATAHLIERGCQRIALVSNGSEKWPRAVGYRKALSEHGIAYDPDLVGAVDSYNADAGERAAAQWLERGVKFDGVVGQSDQHVAGVVKVLLRVGVAMPDQVKLIGVDNSPFCDFFVVPLSSVSQEEFRRGELAVQALMDLIDGKPAPSMTVSPVIYPRLSSQ